MFSLAALAGDWQGTLFVDECFDGLHESGVQAAIDAIREVARTRCVVLTTHRSDLARELRDAVHYKFTAPGEIEQQ
jgi:ABC-type multidrug transport system ATPase subunit